VDDFFISHLSLSRKVLPFFLKNHLIFLPLSTDGNLIDSATKGFFASNFSGAVVDYALSLIPLSPVSGWVDGYTGTGDPPGPCNMQEVTKERYETVRRRMDNFIPAQPAYHLTTFNCQTWAATVLR